MIGLVFAGGGAKGAYQIGAWQAFREQGIEFDVVAGTSIGALNAALVASTDFENARRFWTTLTTFHLIRTEPLLLLGLILRMLSVLARRTRSSQIPPGHQLKRVLALGAIGFPVVILVLTAIAWFFLPIPHEIVLWGAVALTAYALWLHIPEVSELLNGAMVSRKVLAGLIETSIDWEKLATSGRPVFVTMARVALHRHGSGRGKWTEVIPDYVCVNVLPQPAAQACLTASMSLPFGIFPRVELADHRYMDGGLADNIPVYPLILQECDVIYVVHLSPKPRYEDLDLLQDEQLAEALELIDWRRSRTGEPMLYEQTRFTRAFSTARQMRELLIDQETIQRKALDSYARLGGRPVRMIHVVPRHRLGWGIFGTITFSPEKTERLIAMGYEDAKATLQGLRPIPPNRPDWRESRERRGTLLLVSAFIFKALVVALLWVATCYL